MGLFNFRNKGKKVNRRSSDLNVYYATGNTTKYRNLTTAEQSLTNSVVYRSISLISDSVASIPIDIYRKSSNGYYKVDDEANLHKLLTFKPNKRMTTYELLEGIVIQLELYGNAYIHISKRADEIKELTLIYPQCTYYDEINDIYTITDTYNKIVGTFKSNQIIHIRHKSLDTLLGKSVVDYCSKSLGIANASDSESMNNYNAGGIKGILAVESSTVGFGEVQDNQLIDVRNNVQAEINSGSNIITVPAGTDFKSISATASDSQSTETKYQILQDIARFMGLPLSKLGISLGGNYVASELDNMNYFTDCLYPILKKIEFAFTAKLIPESVYDKYKIAFDLSDLTYFKDILASYKSQYELGIMSTNEIRKKFLKQPIENGDEVVISTNLQFLSSPKVVTETPDNEPVEDSKISNNE